MLITSRRQEKLVFEIGTMQYALYDNVMIFYKKLSDFVTNLREFFI